jgi:uroporphyrinogen decarboxylase
MMSDDLGFQDRPMIRLEVFRELLLPAYKQIVDFIKTRKPDLKLVFHSDGVIEQFLPEFIDIGLDAINPVQIGHQSMADLARFKRLYGDKLTFWGGGIDTQHTLPHGTPEEVRAEVRERITHLSPGGGHIFAAIHNVQFDVPPENIQACYDAALEFGKYPIGD